MKLTTLMTSTVLTVAAWAWAAAVARAAPPRATTPPMGSMRIINQAGEDVRVRLISYEYASREPIDIKAGYSVSIPRLAEGDYVLVVHSRTSKKVLLGPAETIAVARRVRQSDPQTAVTLKKEGQRYKLETTTERYYGKKAGRGGDKK
jgi:hypothetical protein